MLVRVIVRQKRQLTLIRFPKSLGADDARFSGLGGLGPKPRRAADYQVGEKYNECEQPHTRAQQPHNVKSQILPAAVTDETRGVEHSLSPQ
jgi:hypothetical protein